MADDSIDTKSLDRKCHIIPPDFFWFAPQRFEHFHLSICRIAAWLQHLNLNNAIKKSLKKIHRKSIYLLLRAAWIL